MNVRIEVKTLREKGEKSSDYGRTITYQQVEKYEIKNNQKLSFIEQDNPTNILTFDDFCVVKLLRDDKSIGYGAIISQDIMQIENMFNKVTKDYIYFYLKNDVFFDEVMKHTYLNEMQSIALEQYPFKGNVIIKVEES